MKKISLKLIILSLLMIILFMTFNTVKAYSRADAIEEYIEDFFESIEDRDENVFTYIDSNNAKLRDEIESRLFDFDDIDFKITKMEKTDDGYQIKARISAEGSGENGSSWKVEGMTTKINLLDRGYDGLRIKDTDFFEVSNPAFGFKIVLLVFAIVFGIFALSAIAIVVIIIVVIKTSNKNKK